MKQELQQKLYDDFPDLYQQRHWSIQASCMPWGMECGSGWEPLIRKLSEDITAIAPDVQASQVKEKFGGLRFYFSGGNDEVYELVNAAEDESYKICENCGSRDGVTQSKGWIKTECKKCRDNEQSGEVSGKA